MKPIPGLAPANFEKKLVKFCRFQNQTKKSWKSNLNNRKSTLKSLYIFASAFQMSLRGHRLESSNEKCLEIKLIDIGRKSNFKNIAGCDLYFFSVLFSPNVSMRHRIIRMLPV